MEDIHNQYIKGGLLHRNDLFIFIAFVRNTSNIIIKHIADGNSHAVTQAFRSFFLYLYIDF